MTRARCPECLSTRTISVAWMLARRSAVVALVLFWIGMITMFILGLQGMAQLGAEIWLGLTAAPVVLFLAHYAGRRHDASYRDGRRCENCGHHWTVGAERVTPDGPGPSTDERLRWIAQQRAAQLTMRPTPPRSSD